MATNFIPINTTAAGGDGQALKQYTENLYAAKAAGQRIAAKMQHMIDTAPNPPDYTLLETRFGLPAGRGEAVYQAIVAANTAMNDAFLVAIIERLG